MFLAFPAHHQELNDCSGSLWFYLRIVVIVMLCSWSGRPAERNSTTQVRINVISRRLRVIVVAVQKQETLHILSVCLWP